MLFIERYNVRYKIKVPSDSMYHEVEEKLHSKKVQVFVASQKRRMFSTGSIPQDLLSDIRKRGVAVTTDKKYSIEANRRA